MRVILLTTNHYMSANVATRTFFKNTLLRKHGINVVGIVAAEMWMPGNRGWKQMLNFLKKSGLRFFAKSIATSIGRRLAIKFAKYCIPNKNRKIFEIAELAQQYRIPLLTVEDINCRESRQFIKKKKPAYLVSCLLLQKVEKKILDIPSQGSINFHPSLFQDHRGTFSSFWALLRNQKKSGATVHFMTEKLDDGKVILQRHFFIHPSDTLHCINEKSAVLGANLLAKALVKLKRKKAKTMLLKKFSRVLAMPNKKQASKFHKRGKRLIRWRDLFKV